MSLPYSLNPSLADVPVYVPGRPIEEVAREIGLDPEKIIKLASNENPLGPSPAAVKAMKQVLEQLHLYPDGNAFHLKSRLAEKLGLSSANLILGNGSNEIIEFVGHALIGQGTDVVVSQYCFAVYPIVTKLLGGNLIVVPAKNYGHDLEAMLAAITPKTRIVFVANPNNPTGTLIPNEDVLNFIRKVPAHVVIAMDEAYLEFLEKPLDLLPMIRSGSQQNLLLMRTFSKIFGLAGLRLGYGIAHPEMIAGLEKVRQPFNINSIAQAGALAALDDAEHIAKTRANNLAGLNYLISEFIRLGLEFLPSSANFILLKTGKGQATFEALQKKGVIVRPLAGYQMSEWIRISIGTPAENERFIKTLALIL
jgi:histidinol-phosphate aminotransferase